MTGDRFFGERAVWGCQFSESDQLTGFRHPYAVGSDDGGELREEFMAGIMGPSGRSLIKILEYGSFYVDEGLAGGGDWIGEVLILGNFAEAMDDGCFHNKYFDKDPQQPGEER